MRRLIPFVLLLAAACGKAVKTEPATEPGRDPSRPSPGGATPVTPAAGSTFSPNNVEQSLRWMAAERAEAESVIIEHNAVSKKAAGEALGAVFSTRKGERVAWRAKVKEVFASIQPGKPGEILVQPLEMSEEVAAPRSSKKRYRLTLLLEPRIPPTRVMGREWSAFAPLGPKFEWVAKLKQGSDVTVNGTIDTIAATTRQGAKEPELSFRALLSDATVSNVD